ncbi:MAG: OmpH family outer membrane protein [Bacteroidales bacterium]|nr:OmpH family outer membrane protein [Bacteroidales bacterium]
MVKRVILVVLMIVPMMVMAQNIKLGKVDKVAIFNAMPEKVEAEAQIKLLSDQYQKEYDLLRAEYNRKYADFQAMAIDNKTPGTIKERRMQELQENNDKIELFMKSVSADLEKKEQEFIAPLKKKIDEAVAAVGEAGGYLLIYDVNDTKIAYASDVFEDVTPLVKAQLNMK